MGISQPASINQDYVCFANGKLVKYLVPAIDCAFFIQDRLRIFPIPPFSGNVAKRVQQFHIPVFEMLAQSGHRL